jgi:flagellar hook-associated protein 1 FlgK
MLRFQRSFDASARVITIVDSMLDRLINGTGMTR